MAVKIITMEIVSKKSGKAIEVSFPMDESLFKASFSLPKKKRILFLTEAYHEFKREEKMKLLFGNRYNHEFDDYIYVFENGDLVRPNWVTACFKRLLDDNNMPISDSMIYVIAAPLFSATREFRWKTSRNGSAIPIFLPRSRSMPIVTT